MKNKGDIQRELDSLFDYEDDKQDLKFEEIVLNSSAINTIQELMDKSKDIKTQAQLAEKLNISEARISKLFSGNQYVNIKFLAQIQRLFNVRFKVIDNRKLNQVPSYTYVNVNINIGKEAVCDDMPSAINSQEENQISWSLI